VKPARRLVDRGRVLVLSYYFPPISAGPTFVIRTLLGQFDLSGMTIFSGNPARYPLHRDASLLTGADVRRYDVPSWWPLDDAEVSLGIWRVRVRARALGNVLVALRVALASLRELRKRETRALLAVYPKQHFLLAACLASLASRKPLLVYFMDVYVEGLEGGRRVARMIERIVASRAAVVFAMSEPHREHLERTLARGGRSPVVIELPHPYEDEDAGAEEASIAEEGRPAIVFTGAIYDAQADAIRRLIAALRAPELADVHLHLLTQTKLADLAKHGIKPSKRVHIATATRAGARVAQRTGDLLFLPIAFDAKEHVRRTASPSKLPEYLAAGRPILVHAPPDSYVTQYASRAGFGELVDQPSERELATAVRHLLDEPRRGEHLVTRAADTLERHRAPAVAASLVDGVAAALAGLSDSREEQTQGAKVIQPDESGGSHDSHCEWDTDKGDLDVT
jgi:hypothetical protein